ncbi:MAG: alfa-L-rhamnosidase, partial [Oscillospiraceae bacterium]|nr:alfa-L-rhamnosidase [Oscillospiraceae bacterium]
PLEEQPGYKKVKIAPKTDSRLKWLSAQYESRFGWIRSKWQYIDDNTIRYDIEVPVLSEIIIGDDVYNVEKGLYTFYSTN